MSQHFFPGNGSSQPQTRNVVLQLDEGDEISALQALINILRQPQDHACPHCLGRGTYLAGTHCEHCLGSGKRPRTRAC